MRRGVFVAAAGLFAVAGCWFRLGEGTGAVELSWTFDNGQNCRTAGVTQLEVAGAGPTVFLPCVDIPGTSISTATLPAVPAGTQTFILSGIGPVYDPDAGETRLLPAYRSSFTFDISEASTNITVPVDLAAVDPSGQSGDLFLLWGLERGGCAAAGVSEIHILESGVASLAGGAVKSDVAPLTVPCDAGGLEGVRLLGLQRGLYSFPVWGDGRGYTYAAAPTAYVTGHTETVQHVDLHNTEEELDLSDTVTLTLALDLGDGGSCESTGIGLLTVDLQRTEVNGIGGGIDGTAATVDVELEPDKETIPCWKALDAGIAVTGDSSSPAPCSAFNGSGSGPDSPCPLSLGEYHLSVQGQTANGTPYALGDYDLWVDEGLANGATAGPVPEYGDFPSGNPFPSVTNFYRVTIPAP